MSKRLSETERGLAWVSQFKEPDRADAARLLNALRLLDENDVSTSVLTLLEALRQERSGARKRVALYAEREFQEYYAFDVESRKHKGITRLRAVGKTGVPAIKPIRGSSRVGSEGPMAFLISQAVATWPNIYANHPGPDRFRAAKPIGAIGLVTDFIGSGARVSHMLTKFWNVPTVRSWRSLGWIEFYVVAAAATAKGLDVLRSHRTQPDVRVAEIIPTLAGDGEARKKWRDLAMRYGPNEETLGYGDAAALVAFSYRMPNNVPAILGRSYGNWRPLYQGAASSDIRQAFGPTPEAVVASAAAGLGVELVDDLTLPEARLALFLSSVRGRFYLGEENAIAELTALSVSNVQLLHKRALKEGLMTRKGRLTDAGYKTIQASGRLASRATVVPTNETPYYPKRLRIP